MEEDVSPEVLRRFGLVIKCDALVQMFARR